MSTQQKWRILRHGDQWMAIPPEGEKGAALYPSHAEAVEYMDRAQRYAAGEKLKGNPKAALAMLVLAGLAAAAKKGKAGK